MISKLLNWCACVAMMTLAAACSDDSSNARLEVWLTDAPGDFQEVNVEITGIEIHTSESDDGNGWQSLSVNAGVYDLLKLTNGLDTLLGSVEIPAGRISQIRLKLGNNNSIKVNDETFSLETPSGQQSGLKLQVHETLVEDITYKMLLDFDVARSVVENGEGNFILKPVIRAITKAQDGAIKGAVTPLEAKPAIYAVLDADTIGTTYPDSTGHFLLRGLPAGEYKILFSPSEGFSDIERDGVQVQLGTITDLGTVTIPD